MLSTEYSQGIAEDGPCILKNGQPMTPDEIVKTLNDQLYTIKLSLMLQTQLKEQLNDCINFDGGKLTDSVMERSTELLDKIRHKLKSP